MGYRGFINVHRETLFKINGVEYVAGLLRLYPGIDVEDAAYREMEGSGFGRPFPGGPAC